MGVATGCDCKEVYRFPHTTYPYSSCICSFLQQHPYFLFIFVNVFRSLYIYYGSYARYQSRDERDAPLTQYITNAGISRVRYTITHFKYHHRVLRLISNRMSV